MKNIYTHKEFLNETRRTKWDAITPENRVFIYEEIKRYIKIYMDEQFGEYKEV